MSELTVIGLGAMGSAIAQTLIDNQCDLTVWNRSSEKVKSMVELGASSAETLKQAIKSSPRILLCIHGYATTRSLLDDPEIISFLPGRTIMQMITGTPAEARAAEAWVNEQSGHYLDCSIMVFPQSVGKTSRLPADSSHWRQMTQAPTALTYVSDMGAGGQLNHHSMRRCAAWPNIDQSSMWRSSSYER